MPTARRAGRNRVIPGPADPDQHAVKIAEAAASAWHGHHGVGDLDIPLSTVAALALLTPPAAERDAVAGEWIALTPHMFRKRVLGLWNWVVLTRPDLANPVWPLISVWHNGNRPMSESNLAATKHVADAVLRADLIGLTGTNRRFEADPLGAVLTLLRPKGAWQARGQYYTPAAIADALTACLIGAHLAPPVDEGQSVNDPACGTGGMLRAAAQRMRQAGNNPHTTLWSGCDIDPMAIACFAVNAIVWDLGPNVIAACGDTLAWDGFYERAVAARQEMITLVRGLIRDRMMLDLLRDTATQVDQVESRRPPAVHQPNKPSRQRPRRPTRPASGSGQREAPTRKARRRSTSGAGQGKEGDLRD